MPRTGRSWRSMQASKGSWAAAGVAANSATMRGVTRVAAAGRMRIGWRRGPRVIDDDARALGAGRGKSMLGRVSTCVPLLQRSAHRDQVSPNDELVEVVGKTRSYGALH